MKRSIKRWIGASILMLFVSWGALQVMMPRPAQYKQFIQVLPESLRIHYLNHVFDQATPSCDDCYGALIGALEALEENANQRDSDYGFDYAKLIPLLRRGSNEFHEPVPQAACNLLLKLRRAPVYQAMSEAFQEDSTSLQVCIANGFKRLNQHQPSEYELTREALKKVPLLWAYLEAAESACIKTPLAFPCPW